MKVEYISDVFLKLMLLSLVLQLDFISDGVSSVISILFYCLSLMFVLTTMMNFKVLAVKEVYVLFAWSIFYLFSALLSVELIHGFKIYLNSSLLYFLIFISFLNLPLSILEKAYNNLASFVGFFVVLGSLLFLLVGDYFIPLIANSEFQHSRKDSLIGFSGVFYNQNALGPVLVLYSSWMFHKLLNSGSNNRWVFIVFFVISFFLLLITVSRASVLMLFCFLFLYLLLNGNFKYISLLTLFFFIVISVFVFLYPEVYDFFLYRLSDGGTSNRDIIWGDALNKWIEVPFFGLGPNQYSYFLGDTYLSTHSFYISSLVNTGVFSLLTFFAFLSIILLNGVLLILKSREKNVLIIYCISFIFSLMIHQLFETKGFDATSITGIGAMLLMALICKSRIVRC